MHMHIGLLEVITIAAVVVLVQFFERMAAMGLPVTSPITKAFAALSA